LDVQRDATGSPLRIGACRASLSVIYPTAPTGALAEVRQADTLLARYTHNTHGLRIAKTVYGPGGETKGAQQTQYLWQGMKLVAETQPQAVSAAAKGVEASAAKLARRYVYAHSVPVAVIDYADGAELRADEGGVGAWFVAVWRWISNGSGELRYVQANEIGVPGGDFTETRY
jgi:hypothetical protein